MRRAGRIWIQGAGELASGVAVRLFRCGYHVIMAEIPAPLAVRRLVCFSEAVYGGRQTVEDVPAVLVPGDRVRWRRQAVQVCVDPGASGLPRASCDAVVDARMTKKPPLPLSGWDGPVVGLGPGFLAGTDAVFVVETQRGPSLGRVISDGAAAPNTGVPGEVGGESSRRVVRAPGPGRLLPLARIGQLVSAGQVLGEVGGIPVHSALQGRLRGLVHERAELFAGVKVADVDPRGLGVDPSLVSDKALAVAGGVLEALLRLRILPGASWQGATPGGGASENGHGRV